MAQSPETHDARVSWIAQTMRYAVVTSASVLLPTETPKPKSEGWQRAEQLNREHYGIIIAHMHANKSDSLRVIKRVFRSPIFRIREIFLPIAMHRYKDWYRLAGIPIHAQVFPVFTKETGRLTQEDPALAKKLKDKYGVDLKDAERSIVIARYTKQYINQAIQLLQRAGVEIVAPQGQREGTLTTMTTAIESIVKRALHQDIHNIAVLFVGYNIKGVQNYGDEKNESYNLFKKYRFRDGECLTVDELITKADRDEVKLSEIIRGKMEATVPPEYLPTPYVTIKTK